MFSTTNILIASIFIASLAQISTCTDIKEDVPRLNYVGNVGAKQFFTGQNDRYSWRLANLECFNDGKTLAILNSTAEFEFIKTKMFGAAPVLGDAVWFGARDIGRREMYVWADSDGAPMPGAPGIGDFIYYYNSVEDGPMALTMQKAYGPALVGVHSHKQIARALCQLVV